MKIGKNLKKYRKLANLTQEQLAKKAHMSRGYLADLERDRYNPSLDTMETIAKALNIETYELMYSEKAQKIIKNSDKIIDMYNRGEMVSEQPNFYNTKITDIKEAMKIILEQPGLMLNGEPLSDESKIALANAINMGLAYAEQMNKKDKGNKNNE